MKITQNVLAVLSSLSFDGPRVSIGRPLDRQQYVAVDKVLKACGGKWTKSVKAHVFGEDAEPIIDAVILAGEVRTARDDGYFPTPVSVAADLVRWIGVGSDSNVLEPSAGDGRIVREILKLGACVTAVELDVARHALLGRISLEPGAFPRFTLAPAGDFDAFENPYLFTHVAMNPPFLKGAVHLNHVERAFSMLEPGGVLGTILPSGIVFREDRRHERFRLWVNELGGTIEDLPDGTFKESGTSVRAVRVRIERP